MNFENYLNKPLDIWIGFDKGTETIALVSMLADAATRKYVTVEEVSEKQGRLWLKLSSNEMIEPFSLN
jgi:hypothetical protein